MVSAGFQWGVRPSTTPSDSVPVNESVNTFQTDIPRYTPSINNNHQPQSAPLDHGTNAKKRKILEDDNTSDFAYNSSSSASAPASFPPHPASHIPNKFHHRKFHNQPTSASSNSSQYHKFKRSKTPRILGQTLPLNRLIEVLDQRALQSLLTDLVRAHPEIATTVSNMSPKPTMQSSISLMKEKFEEIINHLPYKCDMESDYSYLRIKSHLNEFLNCLSDFILNFLPPIESGISNSLVFLDHITDLIHELPNFTNNEFQYTKSLAYEQIANAWFIVLNQKIQHEGSELQPEMFYNYASLENGEDPENSLKLIKVINELNLEEKLERHNDKSLGKFKVIMEYIKSEVSLVEMLSSTVNNMGNGSGQGNAAGAAANSVLGDLITVDYSKFSISARTSH